MAPPEFFFAGSVQDAVQATIENGNHLVAFVRDENEESARWENEFLPEIRHHLNNKAITLRLTDGSENARYLTSIFPVPNFPTVVIIYQGQLADYIAPGLTKDEFISRVDKVFSIPNIATDAPESSSSQAEPVQTEDQEAQEHNMSNIYAQDDPMIGSVNPSTAAQLEAYRAVAAEREVARARAAEEAKKAEIERKKAEQEARRLREIEERRLVDEAASEEHRRLEQQRRDQITLLQRERAARREEEEERARKARQEGDLRRKEAAEQAAKERKENGPHKPKLSPAEREHRDRILKQKAEVENERKRIIAQIEVDKADRRHREEARRMNREQVKKKEAEEAQAKAAEVQKRRRILGTVGPDEKTCALQVRLLGGGVVVRARFGGESTIKQHVRRWVDESILENEPNLQRPPPYRLKVIRTPMPNMTFLPGDEEKTIMELGMAPTATLVVVHGDGMTGGFDAGGSSDSSILGRVKFFLFVAIWAWLGRLCSGFLAMFRAGPGSGVAAGEVDSGVTARVDATGREARAKTAGTTAAATTATGTGAGAGVGVGAATGVDHGDGNIPRRRLEQYYNGNSTAFEARPNDDDDDDDDDDGDEA